MRIHVDKKPIVLGDSQHLDGVAYPLLVVYAWTFRLDGLPREYVPNGIVAIPPKSGEVDVRIVFGEGTLVKADIVAVEEVVGYLCWLVKGFTGIFGVGCHIYTAENDLSARWVDKLAVFDQKAERSHGVERCVARNGLFTVLWEKR